MSGTPMRMDADGKLVPLTDAEIAQQQADAATLKPPPRSATGRQLRYALNAQGWRAAWDASVAASKKPDDVDYWLTLSSGDLAPETNPKLARIASAANPPIDLKALYDAALAA